MMLSWFVEADVANNAFQNGILIKENQVEVQPEKVPMKYLDEDVFINLIRKYFIFDGWLFCKRKDAGYVQHVCDPLLEKV